MALDLAGHFYQPGWTAAPTTFSNPFANIWGADWFNPNSDNQRLPSLQPLTEFVNNLSQDQIDQLTTLYNQYPELQRGDFGEIQANAAKMGMPHPELMALLYWASRSNPGAGQREATTIAATGSGPTVKPGQAPPQNDLQGRVTAPGADGLPPAPGDGTTAPAPQTPPVTLGAPPSWWPSGVPYVNPVQNGLAVAPEQQQFYQDAYNGVEQRRIAEQQANATRQSQIAALSTDPRNMVQSLLLGNAMAGAPSTTAPTQTSGQPPSWWAGGTPWVDPVQGGLAPSLEQQKIYLDAYNQSEQRRIAEQQANATRIVTDSSVAANPRSMADVNLVGSGAWQQTADALNGNPVIARLMGIANGDQQFYPGGSPGGPPRYDPGTTPQVSAGMGLNEQTGQPAPTWSTLPPPQGGVGQTGQQMNPDGSGWRNPLFNFISGRQLDARTGLQWQQSQSPNVALASSAASASGQDPNGWWGEWSTFLPKGQLAPSTIFK